LVVKLLVGSLARHARVLKVTCCLPPHIVASVHPRLSARSPLLLGHARVHLPPVAVLDASLRHLAIEGRNYELRVQVDVRDVESTGHARSFVPARADHAISVLFVAGCSRLRVGWRCRAIRMLGPLLRVYVNRVGLLDSLQITIRTQELFLVLVAILAVVSRLYARRFNAWARLK
jgi:hypothetical protein